MWALNNRGLGLNLRTLSVSDGHVFFTSVGSLPVPVAHAQGSQINAPALRKSQE